jgi:Metallo-peptidase family M12
VNGWCEDTWGRHRHELLMSLGSNDGYMREHKLAGYDVGLVISHHHTTAMKQFDTLQQWQDSDMDCLGGIAFGIESIHKSPFGVVALDCLMKGHIDVATHEVGHLFGADHDEESLHEWYDDVDIPWSELEINERMAYKVCGSTVRNSRRTIMAYDCPGMYVPRIPHFSCKHYDCNYLPLDYAATSDKHGASNCDGTHRNIGVISGLGTLHPTLAARQNRQNTTTSA